VELRHSFVVPVDQDTAWAAFQDVAAVAECFPGAAVTAVEGDTFQGSCKVKLGPIALQYAGSGTFLERDASAYRMVLQAKGKDKRGNGTAGADVTATFAPGESAGSTRVDVLTQLNVTGKPAQFGRGVMQDVSDKLLGQFVDCLRSRIAPAPTVAEGATTEPEVGDSELAASSSVEPPRSEAAPVAPAVQRGAPEGRDDALDLGATVLPVLLRTYAKPAAGLLVVLLLLLRWRRGRRR
jgi:uncharacterized protein